MNKSAKKKNLVSIILTVLVIGLYLLPNFASAISVAISDILNTNKGNDIKFNITVDIEDPDRFVPINFTNLTIEHTGTEHVDKLECTIKGDGDFTCYRTKGNHKTQFTNIKITETKATSLGFGYGYGYANGYGYAPDSGYGYAHNFGYGYGYGYGTPSPQFGKIIYNVLWHTPVNLHPGQYTAIARLYANEKIFSSDTKIFNITTPANPVRSYNQTVNIPANQGTTVNATVADTILSIVTGSNASGLITVDKYTNNPTTNTSIFGIKGINKFIGIEADSSIDDALTSATINISYTDAEVSAAGLDENTLRLYFFNSTSNGWIAFNPPKGGVDTANNYVWAITNHFSTWGIFGTPVPSPSPAPSGGGTPTGGGGGSGYYWQCSEWSECAPTGIQTRTCSLVVSPSGSTTKPEESRTCTYITPAPTTGKAPTAPTVPTPTLKATPTAPSTRKGLAALTGAVISGLTKPSGIAAILVLILVSAALYAGYYYLYKKK